MITNILLGLILLVLIVIAVFVFTIGHNAYKNGK